MMSMSLPSMLTAYSTPVPAGLPTTPTVSNSPDVGALSTPVPTTPTGLITTTTPTPTTSWGSLVSNQPANSLGLASNTNQPPFDLRGWSPQQLIQAKQQGMYANNPEMLRSIDFYLGQLPPSSVLNSSSSPVTSSLGSVPSSPQPEKKKEGGGLFGGDIFGTILKWAPIAIALFTSGIFGGGKSNKTESAKGSEKSGVSSEAKKAAQLSYDNLMDRAEELAKEIKALVPQQTEAAKAVADAQTKLNAAKTEPEKQAAQAAVGKAKKQEEELKAKVDERRKEFEQVKADADKAYERLEDAYAGRSTSTEVTVPTIE
ncbi:MAG: hypothetical protein ACKO34_02160 [Vampirovibrionales bacterium]